MTLVEALKHYDKILDTLYVIWSRMETSTTFRDFVIFHFHSEERMPILIKEWLRCKQKNN